MIFVTVGTHEQQFNRLVEYMDKWARNHDEKVIIQTGFSTYVPQNCEWHKILPYCEMKKNVEDARVIITHGGPSSFIAALQIGKIPIVVPRRKDYGEHVNDHQIEFCRQIAERKRTIMLVEDVFELENAIEKYSDTLLGMKRENRSNNEKFCLEFEKIVSELFDR